MEQDSYSRTAKINFFVSSRPVMQVHKPDPDLQTTKIFSIGQSHTLLAVSRIPALFQCNTQSTVQHRKIHRQGEIVQFFQHPFSLGKQPAFKSFYACKTGWIGSE